MEYKAEPLTADEVLFICRELHAQQELHEELEWLEQLLASIDTKHGDPESRLAYHRTAKALAALHMQVWTCYCLTVYTQHTLFR